MKSEKRIEIASFCKGCKSKFRGGGALCPDCLKKKNPSSDIEIARALEHFKQRAVVRDFSPDKHHGMILAEEVARLRSELARIDIHRQTDLDHLEELASALFAMTNERDEAHRWGQENVFREVNRREAAEQRIELWDKSWKHYRRIEEMRDPALTGRALDDARQLAYHALIALEIQRSRKEASK